MNKLTYLILLLSAFAQAQVVTIPDANFKNALVNLPCADIGNDYTLDVDADSNDDGEISLQEAQAVTSLQLIKWSSDNYNRAARSETSIDSCDAS